MERTYLNYLLIAAFMFFIFSIVLYMFSEGIIKNNFFDNNIQENNLKYPDNNVPITKDSTPGKNNSGDSSILGSIDDSKELPLNINSSNCGFYYSEYGVCAGICPEGKCISEKRSCYCKKV